MEINKHGDEEEKRSSRRVVHPQPPSQVPADPDFTIEQEQRTFTPLPCIESDEETTSDEEMEFEDYNYEYEYFSSRSTDAELGFLEEEYEDSQMEMEMEEEEEEEEIDPDDLSYEQLIELGELIGEEKRGLSVDQISLCLRPMIYNETTVNVVSRIERCVVCQIEYEEGEQVAELVCHHTYHSECIGEWLQIKKTCPICSNEVSTLHGGNEC